MKLLMIGPSVRHIACSAVRSGHNVIAADCFCDMDLCESIQTTLQILRPNDLNRSIQHLVESIVSVVDPDAILLGPGLEACDVRTTVEILNSAPQLCKRASDKLWLCRWLERRGFPTVPTIPFDELDDINDTSRSVDVDLLDDINDTSRSKDIDLLDDINDTSRSVDVDLHDDLGNVGRSEYIDLHDDLGNVGRSEDTGLLGDTVSHRKRLIKPRWGAGGIGCRMLGTGHPYTNDDKILDEMIAQPHISGYPASVSVISNGETATAIAVNEQLIGLSWLNANRFRYCGTVTPLGTPLADSKVVSHMAMLAEEVVAGLGLVGSNGVDFIISKDGPLVLEVNPRFQGSLDAVEMATGLNVFKSHLDSFHDIVPKHRNVGAKRAAGRAVLYADSNIRVDVDMRRFGLKDAITDVPYPGSTIRRGDPIVSLIRSGNSISNVKADLMKSAVNVGTILGPSRFSAHGHQ